MNLGAANPGYLQAGQLGTGLLTVEGSGYVALDSTAGSDSPETPSLPSAGVTLTGNASLVVAATNATSGPIDASGTTGRLEVISGAALPQSTLSVTGGVTLGSSSALEFDINGDSASDASSVAATGTVDLHGAPIYLYQEGHGEDNGVANPCVALTPGTSHTLLTAAGTLTGDLSVGGQLIGPGHSAAEAITTTAVLEQHHSCQRAHHLRH